MAAPVANPETCSFSEDQVLNIAASGVLANDSADDPQALSAVLVSGPAQGSLTAFNSDGSFSYQPPANFNGNITFTYRAFDGIEYSDPATVTLEIGPVNDAPAFTAGGNQTVNEDAGAQTVTAWAAGIAAGPPDEAGQALTFQVSNDNNALFAVQPSVDASGVLTYTPASNAHGTANVTVALADNGGTANGGSDTSATQTFTITITSVNDAPSFTKGADQTVNEDAEAQTVNGWATNLSAGPADEAGQTLSFQVSNDHNALFAVQPSIDANGHLTYTLAADANGTATVTVALADNGGTGNGGADTSAPQTFTITVTPANDAPTVAILVSSLTVTEGGSITLEGTVTDIDGPDSFSVTVAWGDGTTSDIYLTGGPTTFSFNHTYADDNPTATGSDSYPITVTVTDSTSATGSASETVTVNNAAPSALDLALDEWSIDEEGSVTLSGSFTDPGVLDTVTVVIDWGDGSATTTLELGAGIVSFVDVTHQYLDDDPTGTDADFYTITVMVTDDDSDSVSDYISVLVINLGPVAADDFYEVAENAELNGNVRSNDTDVAADLDGLIVSLLVDPTHGTVELNADGTFTYNPDEDYQGQDQFKYQLTDDDTGSDTAWVYITVGESDPSSNHQPVAIAESYATDEDVVLIVEAPGVLWNDTDADEDTLTAVLIANPQHGNLALNPDGSFFYTPDPDWYGNDYFTYAAFDGFELSNEITVAIIVNAVNDAPIVFETQVYLLVEQGAYRDMDLFKNAYDPDGDTLSIDFTVDIVQPSHGSVVYYASTGLYDYESLDLNYEGLDSFLYKVNDGELASYWVQVDILVLTGPIVPDEFLDFPLLVGALFDNGTPSPLAAQQKLKDCWFVAAAAGLAALRPNDIVNMIVDNNDGTFTVTFPGWTLGATTISTPIGDGKTWSIADGSWLAVLEKAWGQTSVDWIIAEGGASQVGEAYQYIDTYSMGFTGIRALTGSSVDYDLLWCTSVSTTRTKLQNAFANQKVVTAGIMGASEGTRGDGLVRKHEYTVLEYDQQNDKVLLRNPWGRNPVINPSAPPDEQLYIGWQDFPPGDGRFWLSIANFDNMFSDISYEQ